jgi:hypothetical protein
MITGNIMASSVFFRQQMQVDLEKRQYRLVKHLFGLFTIRDEWKKFGKIDYVLLFRTLYAKCETCTAEDFERSSVIQLSLVYNKNRRLIISEGSDLVEMKRTGLKIAEELKLKVRDSATDRRNPVWVSV